MTSRTDEFNEGTERARAPQFSSVQQQSNRLYQQTSVLDQIFPGQNGRAEPDYQRQLVGGQGSFVGRSEGTYDKQLFLHHREPASRIQTLEEG